MLFSLIEHEHLLITKELSQNEDRMEALQLRGHQDAQNRLIVEKV